MGLLGSIWSSVKKGAKKLGKKVKRTVKKIGKKVKKVVKDVKTKAENVVKYLSDFVKNKVKQYRQLPHGPIKLIRDLSTGYVNDLYKEKGKYYLRKGKEIVEISKKMVKDLIKTRDYDDAVAKGGNLANKLRKLGMMIKSEANPVGVAKNTVKQIYDNAQAEADRKKKSN